jgi:indolepyruvate ferredoxin oxidoreductase
MSSKGMEKVIAAATGDNNSFFIPATDIATAILGDAIASNLFMVGYAFQKGLIPVSLEALMKAIELNAVAIEMNKRTFSWGRLMAHDEQKVIDAAKPQMPVKIVDNREQTLDALINHRTDFLTHYQNARYAKRYRKLVDKVIEAEQKLNQGDKLAKAVARYYAKLMAVKDEYEVARLYTNGEFMKKLKTQFEGDLKLEFNLAPPMISKRDPITGRYKKRVFPGAMMKMFEILARFKFLRGTPFDVFGYEAHRKMERQLITEYEKRITGLLAALKPENYQTAIQIASIPEYIRGYDVVKERHLKDAKQREAILLEEFRNPKPVVTAEKKGAQYVEA